MKYTWIKTEEKKPQIGRGFINLSDNVLAKMPGGEYEEVYYNKANHTWYNAENNKKLKTSPLEWCEVG